MEYLYGVFVMREGRALSYETMPADMPIGYGTLAQARKICASAERDCKRDAFIIRIDSAAGDVPSGCEKLRELLNSIRLNDINTDAISLCLKEYHRTTGRYGELIQ